MKQPLLPLTLKCMNPECKEETQKNQFFCSDTCYGKIEHSMRPVPVRLPMKKVA